MTAEYQRWPWLWPCMLFVAGVWFFFRPLALPPDWLDVSLAAVHVAGAIVGYIFIRKLNNFTLQLGWVLISLQILIDFCDEFTRNQSWDTWAQTGFAVSGYLVLAAGLARSQASLEVEAARFRRREQQLRHDANHDKLTGLANRSHFAEELAIRWRQTTAAERDSLAVLFLDLDDFKAVNDKEGHLAGDELLQVVGRRLKSAVRGDDLVARVGGDEFAVLVHRLPDAATLEKIVERVRTRLAKSVIVDGTLVTPRASIGVARGCPEFSRPKDLLRAADAAMYAAKRARAGEDSVIAAAG